MARQPHPQHHHPIPHLNTSPHISPPARTPRLARTPCSAKLRAVPCRGQKPKLLRVGRYLPFCTHPTALPALLRLSTRSICNNRRNSNSRQNPARVPSAIPNLPSLLDTNGSPAARVLGPYRILPTANESVLGRRDHWSGATNAGLLGGKVWCGMVWSAAGGGGRAGEKSRPVDWS